MAMLTLPPKTAGCFPFSYKCACCDIYVSLDGLEMEVLQYFILGQDNQYGTKLYEMSQDVQHNMETFIPGNKSSD